MAEEAAEAESEAPAEGEGAGDQKGAEQKGGGQNAVLKDRFTIFGKKSLPGYATPLFPAYEAQDRRDTGRPLYALICGNEVPARINAMRNLKGVQSAGLSMLVEFGSVYWPPAQRKCMAVIYARPPGPRVMNLGQTRMKEAFNEHTFAKQIITPLAHALNELSERGLSHRNIRPDNLFFADSEHSQVMLGECVTAPAGYLQPTYAETIETGMANPAARGTGGPTHDLYALGATLLVLATGDVPCRNMTDDEVVAGKITYGSVGFLDREGRVPLNLVEGIRGLLADSADDRWTVETVQMWLTGRGGRTGSHSRPPKRAGRVFTFQGTAYQSVRPLAHGFARNPEEAAKVIRDGSLEVWLRRAMEEGDRADTVRNLVNYREADAQQNAEAADQTLVAKVCIVLDPRAPIRFRQMGFMPNGVATALCVAFMQDKNVNIFLEIVQRDLTTFWLATQADYDPEHSMLDATFKELRNNLRAKTMGYGIERALYEMNEGMPCRSPLVARDYVLEITEILPALDQASQREDTSFWPVDSHVAAFIGARFSQNLDRQLNAMSAENKTQRILGMISLLAMVQWRRGPEAMYGLASWIGGLVQPVIEAYHSRERRRYLEKEVPRVVRKGSIVELYNLLDDAEAWQEDQQGFKGAIEEYTAAEIEIRNMENNHEARRQEAQRTGQQTAAVSSVVIALVAVSITILMRLW